MDEAQVKALIRSVLISAGRPIDVYQLVRDFQRLEGEPIPYGSLGFDTLGRFLSSIPDTVEVQGSGSKALFSAAACKWNNHVRQLVSCTKSSYREPRRPGMAAVKKQNFDDYEDWNPPPIKRETQKSTYEAWELEKYVPENLRKELTIKEEAPHKVRSSSLKKDSPKEGPCGRMKRLLKEISNPTRSKTSKDL